MNSEHSYNPLDKKNLGVSVADAMLARPVVQLPLEKSFVGAGIYAIYYVGDLPLYERVTKRNNRKRFSWPIYVGKAVPRGARRGGFGLGEDPGNALFIRLKEHARSIEQAENLDISDFVCRYLIVEDIWIPLGESLLIEKFSPVWNKALDGFGNHSPGKGRFNQQRSLWDVMHPGRDWALRCAENNLSYEDIVASVEEFLEMPFPRTRFQDRPPEINGAS